MARRVSMSKFERSLAIAITLAGLACGREPINGGAPEAALIQEQLGISGGSVPIPAQETEHGMEATWTGSYAELLAADAYAACNIDAASSYLQPSVPAEEFEVQNDDPFLRYLLSNMHMAVCPKYQLVGSVSDTHLTTAWSNARGDRECNIDPVSGTASRLNLDRPWEGPIPYSSTYFSEWISQLNGHAADEVLPGGFVVPSEGGASTPGMTFLRLIGKVAYELAYAKTSLCMAERMSDHLDSVEVAFASEDALAQVMTFVRERALTAVYSYGLIARAMSIAVPSEYEVTHPETYLPAFAMLREVLSEEAMSEFGADFALAIRRLTQVAVQHNEFLLRSPAAQKQFATWRKTEEGMMYLEGARVLATELTYGLNSGQLSTVTATDLSDPEIQVLVGLAREADALTIYHTLGAPLIVGFEESSNALYDNVELYYRQQVCPEGELEDADCQIAPERLQDHLIYKRLRITPEHAKRLVAALIEQIWGPAPEHATGPSGEEWHYPFPLLRSHVGDRLRGVHAFLTDRIQLDPEFQLAANSPRDMQGRATFGFTPAEWSHETHASHVGFYDRKVWVDLTGDPGEEDPLRFDRRRRVLGSVPVLGLARESLAVLGRGLGEPSRQKLLPIIDMTTEARTLIDSAIGPRTIILRPETNWVSSTSCDPWAHTDATGTIVPPPANCVIPMQTTVYHARAVTHENDSADEIVVGEFSDDLQTWPDVTGASGALTSEQVAHAAETQILEGTVAGSSGVTHAILLRDSVADRNENLYVVPFYLTFATSRIVTSGGDLNGQMAKAWWHRNDNWSVPMYDAFGLPSDWTPTADAALHGGHDGEETYQYFLRIADAAAREASSAVESAYDTLAAEVMDELARQNAEERGEMLLDNQMDSVCGTNAVCRENRVSYGVVTMDIPACPPSNSNLICEEWRGTLVEKILGGHSGAENFRMLLSGPVAQAIDNGIRNPVFNEFAGGDLQRVMQEQWFAYASLGHALSEAITQFDLSGWAAERRAAAWESAEAAYVAEVAEANLANSIHLDEFQKLNDASMRACNQQRFIEAIEAGISYSGSKLEVFLNDAPSFTRGTEFDWDNTGSVCWANWQGYLAGAHDNNFCTTKIDNYSWSKGPLQAARQACEDARQALERYLVSDIGAFVDESHAAHMVAAAAALQSSQVALDVGEAESAASAEVHLAKVQDAIRRLAASVADMEAVNARLRRARDELRMEQSLALREINTRFGLRRRFRSFDLWRARALSENARRLAVAARRAIESRFVVELSKMNGTEPFVEAPSIWADDIYASDLKPPAALGRTAGPTTGPSALGANAFYSNALVDYVRNLQLFVNGYTVQRPTANVRSDVEIIHFTGPGARRIAGGGTSSAQEVYDPHTAGWEFHCPWQGVWVGHPGDFQQSFDLNTICNGMRPTHARLAFNLDPWGRASGYYARPPYRRRHNVRWNQLAVNLVGAGIRDCTAAADPAACYAEPFVRYELRHIGPSWVTNYENEWRLQHVPTAIVEGGKALTAEEWVDPVINSFHMPAVANVARMDYRGRPVGGAYELVIEVGPDVRLDRIRRIQLLAQTQYWVRQERAEDPLDDQLIAQCGDGVVNEEAGETCDYGFECDPLLDSECHECPTQCEDIGPGCTYLDLVGNPQLCNLTCVERPIDVCNDGDGCCPDGCTFEDDDDCEPVPLPLQIEDVSAWWRADQGITLDGSDNVAAWESHAPGGVVAEQSSADRRPSYVASSATWGGQPALAFWPGQYSGGGLRADTFASQFSGVAPFTAVWAAKADDIISSWRVFWSAGYYDWSVQEPDVHMAFHDSDNWRHRRQSSILVSDESSDTGPHVHAVTYDGTYFYYRIDGTLSGWGLGDSEVYDNLSVTPTVFGLGGNPEATDSSMLFNSFDGTMPELIFYSRALDLSEIQQLEQYMLDRYDLN